MTRAIKYILLLPALWLFWQSAQAQVQGHFGLAVYRILAAVGWVIIAANWKMLVDWWKARP